MPIMPVISLRSLDELRQDLDRMAHPGMGGDEPDVPQVIEAMKRMCDIMDQLLAMILQKANR